MWVFVFTVSRRLGGIFGVGRAFKVRRILNWGLGWLLSTFAEQGGEHVGILLDSAEGVAEYDENYTVVFGDDAKTQSIVI